jgi:hypothetical protein
MSISNGDFEQRKTGGGPGEAEGWDVVEVYTAEEYAEFTVAVADAATRGQETFEGEWPAGFTVGVIEGYASYFDDLYPAFFCAPGGRPREDFENGWPESSMGPFTYYSLPLVFAMFNEFLIDDPPFDGFETWPTVSDELIPALIPGDNIVFASFGSSPQPYDGFETEWRDNEDFIPAFVGLLTDIGPAYFAIGYTSVAGYDGFEGTLLDLVAAIFAPATDVWTKVGHGLQNGWAVTLTNSGGRLPNGFLTETEYVVQNKTADTFQLAAVAGGTIVGGTDVGFGQHSARHDTTWWWATELTGV